MPGGTIATANEVSLRKNHKQLQADRKKGQQRYQQIFSGNPENLAAGLAKLDPANETIAPEAIEKARQDFGGLTEQSEGETRAAIAEAEKQYEQARKEGRAQEMKEAGETLRVLEGDKTKRATEEAGALVQVSDKVRKRRELLESAVQFGVANQDSTMVTQAREELLELDRATALIKIGRTGELDALTPAEENAIDEPFLDGTSAIDFTTGAPIITDAGRQAVLENFPEAERLIPMSEAEARVRYEGEGGSGTPQNQLEPPGGTAVFATRPVSEGGTSEATEDVLRYFSRKGKDGAPLTPRELEQKAKHEKTLRKAEPTLYSGGRTSGTSSTSPIKKEESQITSGFPNNQNAEGEESTWPSPIQPLHSKSSERHGREETIRDPFEAYRELTGEKALHRRGSDFANEAKRRKPGRRIASGERLVALAEEGGLILASRPLVDLYRSREVIAGGEHEVLYDRRSGRVVKLTNDGSFGFSAEDAGDYLRRLALSNIAFGDDISFEGIVRLPGDSNFRIVTSQPFYRGRDANQGEIADYLNGRGYHFHQKSGKWIHPVTGLSVWDTHTEGNVIALSEGGIQPIDLQIAPANTIDLQEVRDSTGIRGYSKNFSTGTIEQGARREESPPFSGIDTFVDEQGLVDHVLRMASRFGPGAFPGGIAITRLNEGGGLAYQEGKLLVDPVRLEEQGRGAQPNWLEAAVTEEFIHRVSTDLFTREEIIGLWQQLPVEIRKTVKEAYYHSRISEGRELPAEDAWKLGHEFLRMLVQDSHFDSRLTESTAVRSGLTGRVVNLLRRLARRLREMIGRAPREVQGRIREYEEAINRRIDELASRIVEGSTSERAPSAIVTSEMVVSSLSNEFLTNSEQYEIDEEGEANENNRDEKTSYRPIKGVTRDSSEEQGFERALRSLLHSRSAEDGSKSSASSSLSYVEEWARREGLLIDSKRVDSLPILSNSTSEHEVRRPEGQSYVVKRTWPGFYGQIPFVKDGRLGRRNATPEEYLDRMLLQVSIFGSLIRFEGISVSKAPSMIIGRPSGEPSFVISQRFIPNLESPSEQEIALFMMREGFFRVPQSYWGWYRPSDQVAIVDAKPDNFAKTENGIEPLDLQIRQLTIEESSRFKIFL